MHNPLAIRFQNVSKVYRLHGSQSDQLIDVLGLSRFGFKARTPAKEFSALTDISLDVPRGHRIGIVGRNGAGKTTLLKLICGNFAPTSGEVEVHGTVQALMNIGLGFHPEYTGRENVEASLQYNGLAREDYKQAMDGVVEFCELGEFLDQPFKTYSLGMQARLMFAAATAIRPDILIVDEVLGAGDAYFVAKSKARVERLVSSGCTMLLVSHSMQQVLELCDEAIWMDKGRVRLQSDAFSVVKAYEEYIHGKEIVFDKEGVEQSLLKEFSLFKTDSESRHSENVESKVIGLQEPFFRPNNAVVELPNVPVPMDLKFTTAGGISRWKSENGVKICGFTIVTERGEGNVLISLRPAKILLNLVAEVGAEYRCRYGIVFNDHSGNCVVRIYSPVDRFSIDVGATRSVEILLNPVQLGPGEYVLGISVLEGEDLSLVNSTKRFDLLGRSFVVKVEIPDSLATVSAEFFHTAEWIFAGE